MHRNIARASMLLIASGSLVLGACGSGGDGGRSAGGEPVTLAFAHPLPETHYNAELDSAWMEAVTAASDGQITFEVTWAGGLCTAVDINGCVSDGIADLGLTVASYHPADSPVTSISTLGFVTKDAAAQAQAMHALYQESEEYQAEFDDQNQHLLYFAPIEVPVIVSNEPGLTEVNDLRGMKVRANGAYLEALEHVGAAPVTIGINEIYESLERGVVDGAQLSGSAVISDYQLDEVANSVYDLGPYVGATTAGHIMMNTDTWESLSEEHQQVLTDVSMEYVERWGPEFLTPTYEETCQEFADAGMESVILEKSADYDEWATSVGAAQKEAWVAQSGLSDAEAFYQRYVELLKEFSTPETDKSALEYCS